MSMHYRTITEMAPALRARAVSSYDLTRHLLDRIETCNAVLNAFVTVAGKEALEAARKADQELEQGRWRGPLHGVPVAIKDNIATRDIRTTCGSRLFADWVPDRDATVVKRLKDAGAVILGKTGTHELAYGTTSINPFFGAIRNPWDTNRDPGGSSGGSAVAVAAGLAFAALGTDTACSIRHPAHACGVVGFKPSMGLVSMAGIQPLVRTMDHVGTLARSVGDAALVTAAIAGHDPADVYSCNVDMKKLVDGSDGVAGIRLGVIRPFFFDGDSAIMAVVDRAIQRLEQSGATLVPIDGSGLDESLELSRIIFAEAYALYADELERNRDNFSPELARKLRRKSEIDAAHYIDAQHRRLLFRTHLEGLMRQCDVLVAPTATLLPAPIDDRPQDYDDHASRNATVFNLGGQPSVSIPCGFSATGLPVGLMISGRLNRDMNLLGIASRIEGCLAVKATPLEPFTANG